MSISEEFGGFLVGFINAIRDENIRWQQEHLPLITEIDKQRKLSKQDIEQELKRRQLRFESEIQQLKLEGESQIRDYKEFLDAVDKIKDDIRKSYQQLTLPLALGIHQYAKRLLTQMWNSNDLYEREKYERKLFDFLYTVSEDISLLPSNEYEERPFFPEKTLKLIRQSEREK
ncbi:MAG: hypothetical protein WBB28_18775 [Crinalium sp.]